MNKVLFLSEIEREMLIKTINNKLETKNRLIKLILDNPEKKTNGASRSQKLNRYEDQILLLGSLLQLVRKCRTRAEIQELNEMIEIYNKSEDWNI